MNDKIRSFCRLTVELKYMFALQYYAYFKILPIWKEVTLLNFKLSTLEI